MDVRTIRGETAVSTNLAEVYRLMGNTVRDIIRLYSDLKGSDSGEAEELVYRLGLEETLGKKIHHRALLETRDFR